MSSFFFGSILSQIWSTFLTSLLILLASPPPALSAILAVRKRWYAFLCISLNKSALHCCFSFSLPASLCCFNIFQYVLTTVLTGLFASFTTVGGIGVCRHCRHRTQRENIGGNLRIEALLRKLSPFFTCAQVFFPSIALEIVQKLSFIATRITRAKVISAALQCFVASSQRMFRAF